MRKLALMAILAGITMLLQGCIGSLPGFGWINDNKQLAKVAAGVTVSGKVINSFGGEAPLIVVAIAMDTSGQQARRVVAERILYGGGSFQFLLKPDNIALLAFQDNNADGVFQPDERVGWDGKPHLLKLRPGHDISGINITMRSLEQSHRELPQLYRPHLKPLPRAIPKFAIGIITTLDDPRFSADNGSLGMWKPRQFMKKIDSGVYFLTPYHNNKIPVLFVHGVGGNPAEWRTMAEGLDSQHYQAWFFYYPSGLRLPLLGEVLAKTIEQLHQRYRFDKMALVAHSMGGLVSRAAINELTRAGHGNYIYRYITMSTPWDGHDLAAKGVKYSPVIIPCWYDMAVGSPFLRHLFDTPLPASVSYHLLFSYRGKEKMFQGENSDGVITLKSQLRPAAQDITTSIRGFNTSHTGILRDHLALERLRTVLQD